MKENNQDLIEDENPPEENNPPLNELELNEGAEEQKEEEEKDIKDLFLLDQIQNKQKYIVMYNFKDYLMMFGLLMTSSFNFNFLY